MSAPQPVSGDDREDRAAEVAAAIAALYVLVEQQILALIAGSVRRSVLTGAVMVAAMTRLRRSASSILATAEQMARRIMADAGVPWDHEEQPQLPPPEVTVQPPADAPQADGTVFVPEPPQLVSETPAPSLRDLIEQVSDRVYRQVPDLYQQAVQDAINETRGGLPGNSLSLSRIQAAQKALDKLAEHGITGFTDRAGRNWDLLAYVEMATRTAVARAYDNHLNAALIRGGHDLIYTYSESTEGSCPLCRPWLYRVLSLTGATTGQVSVTKADGTLFTATVHATLAEARAEGFRHPNCRCSWLPVVSGMNLAFATLFDLPPEDSAAVYKASQVQRAYERRIRRLGRLEQTALTPAARARVRRDLATARSAAAAHRRSTGLRMTKVGVERRHHPTNAH